MQLRLFSPTSTEIVHHPALDDVIVYKGKVYRRDQAVYKDWADPTTYTVSEEPITKEFVVVKPWK